jgi:hypothetical protein
MTDRNGSIEARRQAEKVVCPLPAQRSISVPQLYVIGFGMSTACPTCKRDDFASLQGLKNHHAKAHDAVLIDWTECEWCEQPIIDDPRASGGDYCSPECSQKASSEKLSCELVEVECRKCGNRKEIYPYRAPDDKKLDSCSECWGERVDDVCETCGTHIEIRPYRKDQKHFCSESCESEWQSERFSGETHPRWTGGSNLQFGDNWEQKRREQLDKSDECAVCGMSREQHYSEYRRDIHVHHIRPRREYIENKQPIEKANKIQNLMTLCQIHHRQVEAGTVEVNNE